jgi:hypothetical protein
VAKVKLNYDKQREWFDTPEGTQEELTDSFEIASNYLYNILYYGDKPEIIPQYILDQERRIFSFCKKGPRAAYFRLDPNSKLVSADVLYMLTSTLPAKYIAEKFNMCERKVRAIRRGEVQEWYWEYLLVRRLTTIITTNLKRTKKGVKSIMYSLSKMIGVEKYENLGYATSRLKLVQMRKDILDTKVYAELENSKTLDIVYPIKVIDLL